MKKDKWISLIVVVMLGFGLLSSLCEAQSKPKQHVFYDTVKTVKERVDFSPDTIPVRFKEVVCLKDTTIERYCFGYVIWQTYVKDENLLLGDSSTFAFTGSNWRFNNHPTISYTKREYPEITMELKDIFLYADRKTKVTNKVIFSLKR